MSTISYFSTVKGQHKAYWQQQVNYAIQAQLDDVTHSIDGFEQITYINNSPDTLTYIWFHLWPNAYKNDRTAFSEQLLKNGRTDFYFSADSSKGYISNVSFMVNGVAAKTSSHSKHIDIVKLQLPTALLPNSSIQITTPFHVQLPNYFSRSGHIGQSYQVAQWFPKPAVYDANGWHEMPYLDQGEFYSNLGNYDVAITLPTNYHIAATGALQTVEEQHVLKTIASKQPISQANYLFYQQTKKLKRTQPILHDEYLAPPSSSKLKTLHFLQLNCHDFAWFASKQFIVSIDSLQLQQKKIPLLAFYHPWQIQQWQNALVYAKRALTFYEDQIGIYPYETVSLVAGPNNTKSGSMEYPTLAFINTNDQGKDFDLTIAHEIGHNWLYGALANNERTYAWLDEGLNTFFEKMYEKKYYNKLTNSNSSKNFWAKKMPEDFNQQILKTLAVIQKSQAIQTESSAFSKLNYRFSVYAQASNWLNQVQTFMGASSFQKAIKNYYQKWQFKHPQPLQFKQVLQTHSAKNLDSLFAILSDSTSKYLLVNKSQKVRPTFLFNLKNNDSIQYISFAPLAAYNMYDKLMLGGLIHNYQLPLKSFQFLIAPVYATGSKQLNIFSNISYNKYRRNYWLQISNSFSSFSINSFTPSSGATLFLGVHKWVPSIRYTMYNKTAGSSEKIRFQLRNFFLKEEQLRFTTITTPTDTTTEVGKISFNSNILQASIDWSNDRVLYPYHFNVTIDQGKNFIRAGFTGNYFFNYASGKGGIDARFFAGKFIYTTSKTFITQFETNRYHLNLTGANGNEDYTYSDYFFGRNAFEGLASKQIMQRDGFFKVRTDLYSNKIGKTDNWLMALNISGDIPDKLNPLSILPFKLPLKYFFDIGTYAEAWQENPATGKFLYDAGLELSLYKEMLHIYFPILSSKVFRDYNKSVLGENSFWKTVSFSIHLKQLRLTKINRDIPL